FFFQAEDGIRDFHVTGVQTCALPISESRPAIASTFPRRGVRAGCRSLPLHRIALARAHVCAGRADLHLVRARIDHIGFALDIPRSEERRVGIACRYQSWT